jgi:hypothetical protein
MTKSPDLACRHLRSLLKRNNYRGVVRSPPPEFDVARRHFMIMSPTSSGPFPTEPLGASPRGTAFSE